MVADAAAEVDQVTRLDVWRTSRDADAVKQALADLRQAAKDSTNIMPSSIAVAKAGVTTGEWGEVMRSTFGHYRAPTGVSKNRTEGLDDTRARVDSGVR